MYHANISTRPRHSIHWLAYYQSTKPKVVLLIMFTTLVGSLLAASSLADSFPALLTVLGVGLAAASAATFNQVIDVQIDRQMQRTQHRPVVTGAISVMEALTFSLLLLLLASVVLYLGSNPLTALLMLLAWVWYSLLYSLFLKYRTPQNIVLGGAAGALPVVIGQTGITGTLDVQAIFLFLLIFLWTPPHFWALAIHRIEDYRQAGIPMLPVVKGIDATKRQMLGYVVLLWLVSLFPFLTGSAGLIYGVAASGLGLYFLYQTVRLYRDKANHTAIRLFRYSILYIYLLFFAMLLDRLFNIQANVIFSSLPN